MTQRAADDFEAIGKALARIRAQEAEARGMAAAPGDQSAKQSADIARCPKCEGDECFNPDGRPCP